jgi:hypothetical protein
MSQQKKPSYAQASKTSLLAIGGTAIIAWCVLSACGGSEPPPKTATVSPGGSKDPSKWPKDDRTMCDWRNKPDLEVSETAGPGALKPNVRRVYKTFGDGDTRRTVLICREVDTNLDGIKDTVRTFNDKGEALHEEADTDYDGRVDIWMSFVTGRLAEEDVDNNHDGKPDEWKYYTDGKLTRAKRDRNYDGNADIWEIYNNGKLERMGVDETFDGHVDRWDRDEQIKAQEDADAKQAAAALAATQTATAAPGEDAFVPDAGAPGKTAAKKPAPKKK